MVSTVCPNIYGQFNTFTIVSHGYVLLFTTELRHRIVKIVVESQGPARWCQPSWIKGHTCTTEEVVHWSRVSSGQSERGKADGNGALNSSINNKQFTTKNSYKSDPTPSSRNQTIKHMKLQNKLLVCMYHKKLSYIFFYNN
jgi:hypothetical protein